MRNVGTMPAAVTDRWNSWGAHQWTLTVAGRSYSNPQLGWWANFYSETVLAPGEVQAARFAIRRVDAPRSPYSPDGSEWNFMPALEVALSANLSGPSSSRGFTTDQDVQLELDGSRAGPRPASWLEKNPAAPPRWSGDLSVRSRRLDTLQDLESLLKGDDGGLAKRLR